MKGLQAIADPFFLPATTMTLTFAEFDHALRDGRVVHVREMRPEDEEEFVQAFDRLSPDVRYMRFMRFVKTPNVENLRKALASLPEAGFGLVATVPATDGYDIVGSAIYFLGKDPSVCEFATTVAGDFAGAGLGRLVMTTLIAEAKKRGVAVMEGFVLSENKPMLRLAAKLGFAIAPDPDDNTIRLCKLRLADA
jgi:acetyltransferase